MNTRLIAIYNHALPAINESVLPRLTDKQQKFLIITSIAIAILAACYALFSCCGNETKSPKKAYAPRLPVKPIREEQKGDRVQKQEKAIPFEVGKDERVYKNDQKELKTFTDKKAIESPITAYLSKQTEMQAQNDDKEVVEDLDTAPITPKIDVKSADDIQHEQMNAIKDKIFDELRKDELNGDKLKALIEEYSKLSTSMPGIYLITYEEILKIFAAKLHAAMNTKAQWNKLMPVVIKVVWQMQDYNPFRRPEYEEVFDRTAKLKKEFLTLDINMQRLMAEQDSAERRFSIYVQEIKALLTTPGLSDIMKQQFTQQVQEERDNRDKKLKNLDEQMEKMRSTLKDLL